MTLSCVSLPSPSSLESRQPSPPAAVELSKDDSGVAAGVGAVAGGAALELELLSPGTLKSEKGMIGEYKVMRQKMDD